MKRFIIPICILIALCIGSLTAFFIVQNKQDKLAEESAATAADYALFSFNSEEINKVTFQLEDGEYIAELGEEWHFTNTDDFTARHSYVQNVCTYMSTLTAIKDYGKATDENKATYHLDDPVVITATDGTNEYKLYVGGSSPTGEYYYVMTGNKDKIYAIESLYGTILRTTRDLLKDRYLVSYLDTEIEKVNITQKNGTVLDFTYDAENAVWTMPEQYANLTVDNTAVSTMLTIIVRLEAETFYEENLEDYSLYGFDDPDAVLTVTTTDGRSSKRIFSYNGDPSADSVYVLNEETGQVATYSSYDSDFIVDTPAEFLVPYICNINLSSITGFDFKFGDIEESYTVDMENSSISCGDVSISDMGDSVVSDFENFYYSIIYMEFDKLDVEATPEKTELLLSVNFHKTDGTELLTELYKADDETAYVFLNGEYSGALISTSNLTGIHSVEEFYGILQESMAG